MWDISPKKRISYYKVVSEVYHAFKMIYMMYVTAYV